MEHYTLVFTGTEYRTEFQMRSFRQVVLSEDYRHALAWVIYERDYALEEDQKLKKRNSPELQIKIPSRVFGLIGNPSGFGVFSLKPPKINVFDWI